MKKRGLGKGLEALLGNEIAADSDKELKGTQLIGLSKLQPNPYQPRKNFDQEAIINLSESIKKHGIIQPLAIRLSKELGKYEIIAGERRFRAAKIAGLNEVPVIIHDINDNDSAAFALIENLQREDLNVIEKAKGIKNLIADFNLTHEECGKILGKSRSAISNSLRLLDLNEFVQKAVINKDIDMGHARALLALEKPEQHEILNKIILNGFTVRETENIIRNSTSTNLKAKRNKKYKKSLSIKEAEHRLGESFSTKVTIYQKVDLSGKITISFNNDKELDTLINQLKPSHK